MTSSVLVPALPSSEPALQAAHMILEDLFGPPAQRDFTVRLWDGSVEPPGVQPRFTLVLRRPGSLRRMLLPPSELTLVEAYLRDDFDVEGDLEAACGWAEIIAQRLSSPGVLVRVARRLLALPADDVRPSLRGAAVHPSVQDARADGRAAPDLQGELHSERRDAAAVRFHYDLSNDFYALWLDRRMVYSCAYFPTGAEDLDTAQERKLEHLCRKLRLRPGERLLDIGCGWGGLVLHAAQRYGVEVLGITLSQPQAHLARERIAAAGLSDRCRVDVRDYRDLPPDAPFDKVVSVGMFEHVGRKRLATYFAQAFRLTRPGGLFLNHGIVALPAVGSAWGLESPALRLLWREGAFFHTYVFPDGELVSLGEAVSSAEAAGFETRDVEGLREHYARTLRHWVERLEARHADAARLVGEPTYRVWRLYMSNSARGFATGRLGLVQALFSKPGPGGTCELPPTRSDLYQPSVPT
jgi:cyclopropane-fatty-acyl-phospholipid synthase